MSDVILKDRRVNLITCGMICASDDFCQTFFFKALEGKCFLYNYSIWKYTPTKPESGIEIYEIRPTCKLQPASIILHIHTFSLYNILIMIMMNSYNYSAIPINHVKEAQSVSFEIIYLVMFHRNQII